MWIGWTFSPRLKRKFNSIKYMYRVADISWLVFRRSLVSRPLSPPGFGGKSAGSYSRTAARNLVYDILWSLEANICGKTLRFAHRLGFKFNHSLVSSSR